MDNTYLKLNERRRNPLKATDMAQFRSRDKGGKKEEFLPPQRTRVNVLQT